MIEGYKESPIGKIPKHWESSKLGKVTKSFAGGTPNRSVKEYYGGSIPWIKSGEVNNNNIVSCSEYVTELAIKESSAKLIGPNSILVALYGATAGKVGILKIEACSNQAVLAINSSQETLSNDFLYHYLKKCTTELLNLCQGSGQPNLSKGIVDNLIIPLPPLPEQQKIAEILSTVDNKIEVIDQQISETQELKKGLMQRLLTKGIGHTEFKDSPLGEIPESWDVVPIYELRNKSDRYGFTGGPFGSDLKSEHYTKTGVKIIQLQNIGEGKFIDKGIAFTSEAKADELHSCNIFPNEIILAKMAPVARCCKVPSTDERYVMCSDGIRLSIDHLKYDNEFVFQALNSKYFRDEAESKSTGTTRARIGLKELKLIPILIPKSIEEQQKIADILSAVDVKLEILIEKKVNYQELKQGLMQKLLTGKIRVKI